MTKLKAQVIRIVKGLPEDATIDDVMAELYFKMQVDAGLKELDDGKGNTSCRRGKTNVQMARQLSWSPRAADNFEAICVYIAKDSQVYRIKVNRIEIAAICHGSRPLTKLK